MNLEIKSAVGERVRSGMPRNLHSSEQQVFVFTFAAITFDSGIAAAAAAAITDPLALAALAPAIYQTRLLDAMRWDGSILSLWHHAPFIFLSTACCIVIWVCFLFFVISINLAGPGCCCCWWWNWTH